jgi:ADP-ribose pyrophosphatase YjhB (NUDIX family)
MHTYSDPKRDPRKHTISTVFIAQATGVPVARDDAQEIRLLSGDQLNFPLAFDHANILKDYFKRKKGK